MAVSEHRLLFFLYCVCLVCKAALAGPDAPLLSLALTETHTAGRPSVKCGTNNGVDVGPSRDGYCADANQDTHAVCVTMPTNFCVHTGQTSPDWCKQGGYEGGPWCICMWAYETYLEKAEAGDYGDAYRTNPCSSIPVHVDKSDKQIMCTHSQDNVGGGGKNLTLMHQCLGCT